jgi:mannosyltransferase OCH1-like enzyme
MLLHTYGGFYSDMDLNINDLGLLAKYPHGRAFFFVETYLSSDQINHSRYFPIRDGEPEHPERISNYFLGCAPGHPIMLDIIQEMIHRSGKELKTDYDVLYTTGPDLVTTVVQRQREKYPDLIVLSKEDSDKMIQHHMMGEWKGK